MLSNHVFLKSLKEIKFDISDQDGRIVTNFYDPKGTGELNIDNFMKDLMGDFSDLRLDLTELAWRSLDREEQGAVHVTINLAKLMN